MRRQRYSTSIGIVVLGLAGASGCIDNSGLWLDGGAAWSGETVASGDAKAGGDGGATVGVSDAGGKADGVTDARAKDSSASETRGFLDSSVASDVKVVCGPDPLCAISCLYGNALDANGCLTCACLPAPRVCSACPICPYGTVQGATGCLTCICTTDPNLPCSQLPDSTSCGNNANCRWLEPGCATSAGTPALAAAGCFEKASANCSASAECPDGRTCIQRAVNPCPGLNCGSCGVAAGVCL